MPEHLSGERLSALLDDEDPTDEEHRHLEACPACEGELHRLRRMRMALSALDELEAPADGWERIEAALPAQGERSDARGADDRAGAGSEPAGRRRTSFGWSFGGAWARAAAAVVLFAGGLALGTHLSGPPDATDGAATEAASEGPSVTAAAEGADGFDAAAGGAAPASDAGGGEGVADLGTDGTTPLEASRDPAAAAERLARLDAMMQAAREAVREDPTDQATNDLLFRVAEDRQALIDALHLATLEYR